MSTQRREFPDEVRIAEVLGKHLPFTARVLPVTFLLIDTVSLLLTGYFSYIAIVPFTYLTVDYYAAAIFFNWIATVMLFYFADLYRFEQITAPVVYLDKILIAIVSAFLLLLAAAFSTKISETYSRIWVAVLFSGCCVTVVALRMAGAWVVLKLADRRLFCRRVAIFGDSEQASQLLEYINRRSPRFIRLMGVFCQDASKGDFLSREQMVAGDISSLIHHVRLGIVDDIILALPWSADKRVIDVLEQLRELPTNVYLSSDIIGFRLQLRQPPSHFEKLPIVEVVGTPMSGWDVVTKTIEDYVLASVICIILLPLLILIGMAIKLDSSGPIIFRQKRFGFNNQVFEIYKFRTMKHTSEPSQKTIQAARNDLRVTRLGWLLRRTSLDELPQLLNVLNGTMSLVGPRPHAIDHNEEYARKIRGYFARHRVKPGITGLAQVRGFRGATDTLEKMEGRVKNDIFYAENWSLLLDFKILAMTAAVGLLGRNAY